MPKRKLETALQAMLAQEIASAEFGYRTERRDKNARAINYYNGDVSEDTPAPKGRSEIVSRDVADTIDKMLPSIIRTFMASGRVADFEPAEQEDEEFAEQASDLITHIFMKENEGYRILYTGTHDSLLLGDAYITHYWDDTPEVKTEDLTGISGEYLTLYLRDPDVEVVQQEQSNTDAIDINTGEPLELFDLRIKRTVSSGRIVIEAIPPENFLVNSDCINLKDFRFCAHKDDTKTKSDLIEMGFDKRKVMNLPTAARGIDNEEEQARFNDYNDLRENPREDSTSPVDLYRCFMKYDVNEDDVSEIVECYYAGDGAQGELMKWREWDDDLPYTQIPCMPAPHKLESQSVADKTMDIQQIKTVLKRAMIDNQYAHNNPQPIVKEGSVINKDSITSPKFGQPILVRKNAEDPVNWRDTPYIGDKIINCMEYLDRVLIDRTGISEQSASLDPNVLQNQSATAAQIAQDASQARPELIARTMAELGWKYVFRAILKLIVKHQDRPKTVRLRNEWVEMDPSSWNADMDCTVNVGLGTGSRDRDMAMLNVVLEQQMMMAQQLSDRGFPQAGVLYIEKILKTLEKIGESAGLRNADDFHPEFNDEIKQMMLQAVSQPKEDPKIALEKAKMQLDVEKTKIDGQMDQAKLKAEMELDAVKADREAELAAQKMQSDIAIRREQLDAELALKREQLSAELLLKREQMQAELEMKRELGIHQTNVNGAVKASTSGVHVGGEPG